MGLGNIVTTLPLPRPSRAPNWVMLCSSNLVSTVSFGAGGEASSVAVVTDAGGGAGGLGAGAIAGIVVGSVVGAVLLAALTTAVVAGVVVAVRRMKSRDTIQEHAAEVRPSQPFSTSR